MEILEMGAILKTDEKDYILGGDGESFIDINKLPSITGSIYEYNQLEFPDYGKCLCTCYASIGMLSNNNNQKIDQETRLKLVKDRVAQSDFDINSGGYLATGVNRVAKVMNNGIVYRVTKDKIKGLLEKGYTTNIGIYTGTDLSKVSSDGELTSSEIDTIKNKSYGHSTLLVGDKRQNSYVGLKTNLVKIDDLDKYINSRFVFDYAYLIVPNKIIRDYFNNLLNSKSKLEGFKFYDEISKDLYPREKSIFQYCLQMKYIGKINTPELKNLVF